MRSSESPSWSVFRRLSWLLVLIAIGFVCFRLFSPVIGDFEGMPESQNPQENPNRMVRHSDRDEDRVDRSDRSAAVEARVRSWLSLKKGEVGCFRFSGDSVVELFDDQAVQENLEGAASPLAQLLAILPNERWKGPLESLEREGGIHGVKVENSGDFDLSTEQYQVAADVDESDDGLIRVRLRITDRGGAGSSETVFSMWPGSGFIYYFPGPDPEAIIVAAGE